MDDINTITARLISKHTSPQIRNMMRLIDKHFDLWTQELFPVLQDQKVPCYKTVVGILHEAGHTVATESLVRSYFSVIRARRGIAVKPVKAPIGVTPTVTLTTPAREVRPAPVVRMHAAPVAQAVTSPSLEAVPGVEPVEVTDWRAELRRLETQPADSPWNGQDQWMWSYFCEQGNKIGATLPKDFITVERFIKDPIQIDCMNLLMTIRRRNQLK